MLGELLFKALKSRQQIVVSLMRAHKVLWHFPASIISALVAGYFYLWVAPTSILNGDGFHFTCATILGAALALVLSLSIIPAQKAAEAFSTSILKLYARDTALLMVFVVLTATTLASLHMGIKWSGTTESKGAVAGQFLVVGVAFDALRYFYYRTLDLLIPQTALNLVVRECSRLTRRVGRAAELLIKVQRLAGQPLAQLPALRAVMFASSQLSPALSGWIAQLDEFAHKAIARKDTIAANAIVSAMVHIGREYAEARRTSVILLPDWDNVFAGGQSDINNFLAKIHESVRVVCQDAAHQKNELIVQHCIWALGDMTVHAIGITYERPGMLATAPLAYAPVFYLKICVEIAIKEGMVDAILSAVRVLSAVNATVRAGIDTSTMQSTVLDTLFAICVASYVDPKSVTGFPAISAIFRAADRDVELNGYRNQPTLGVALADAEMLIPLEVRMYQAGHRMIHTFPPYSMTFEASIPAILQRVANAVKPPEVGRSRVNPFAEFLEVSKDISTHYRRIATTNFQNVLLVKWISDTVIECAGVHVWLCANAPVECAAFLVTVEEKFRWMISAVGFLFPNTTPFADHHASEAAGSVAFIGMGLLESGKIESADTCAETIAAIANHCAVASPHEFSFADIVEKLEMMALVADKLGLQPLAAKYRRMIAKPATIVDADWPSYQRAIAIRLDQLTDALEEFRYRGIGRYDPIDQLRRIMAAD